MAIKNICNCPNPPGGQTVCEPHQAAYCRVRNGVVETGCADPPDVSTLPTSMQKQHLDNWALGIVMDAPRPLHAGITPQENQILARGRFVDPATGDEVRFRLPWRKPAQLLSYAHAGTTGSPDDDAGVEFTRIELDRDKW